MTVGIMALDGLDWNLVQRTGALSTLPGDPYVSELTNDLPGDPDHGHYSLFTPYVWTAVFSGETQPGVYGWLQPDDWNEQTTSLTFLWDKVPGAVVANLKVHAHYLNENSPLPDGWTPVHGGPDDAKRTSLELVDHWNDTVSDTQPPLSVFWWRLADAWGHWAVKHEEPLEPCYEWIRDEFIPALDFPDDWILVSDHGFRTETADGTDGKGAGGRHQHRPTGVLATNMDAVRYENMTDFVTGVHDDVAGGVERSNLRALGYVED